MSEELDYSINNLIKTFEEHAALGDKYRQESIDKWKENNPDVREVPECLCQDFNVTRAFLHMCKNILELQNLTTFLMNQSGFAKNKE